MNEVVALARSLADDVLFPAALATDRADVLPREVLDALADAGLYGLAAPESVGGFDADFETTCDVIEALSSGCLTTTFVWAQHLGAVHTVASEGSPELQAEWLEPLATGTRRAGLTLGGVLTPPTTRARAADGGWLFSGSTPWLSGWGRIDVFHGVARTDDGNLVWAFVDAEESPHFRVEPIELVALHGTSSVHAEFDDLFVPHERVTFLDPVSEQPAPARREVLRIHAAFALGIVSRCCRLVGSSPLDAQLESLRAELDAADDDAMPAARAAASDLALRAAAVLMVSTGSRSLLRREHAQRLAREALFVCVYGNPATRTALVERLTRGQPPTSGDAHSH